MCLKFTAEQLALAGISSPLVDYATAQKMVELTQASINTSAKIDKGESVRSKFYVLASPDCEKPDGCGYCVQVERCSREWGECSGVVK